MSTPPTPVINLVSPKVEVFEADDIQQWNHDSTESAKNGTLQEWITEPLQMLTSASSASSPSTNEPSVSSSTPSVLEEKNGFATRPASDNGTGNISTMGTNRLHQLASVSTSNGLPTIPVSLNGYHQGYSNPVTTSGHQLPVPGTSNGYHYQIPGPPRTVNSTNFGASNYGVHYIGPNGIVGYSSNNGAHMINSGPPHHIAQPIRPNGYNVNMLNGANGYVNSMANGRFVRPGWISTTKVVNGVKKQKRNRTAFTSHQMMELEQEYARARYLDRTRRIELSEALNLNQRTIKIWFQNRRMKEKKDRLEEVTTSDSPSENINDLPIFVQDGSYVPVGLENSQYNPAMYAENMPMRTMPPTMPPVSSQLHQVSEMSYLVESPMQPYNGVESTQHLIPVNGGTEIPSSVSGEENWDLSWIRSINMNEDMELA